MLSVESLQQPIFFKNLSNDPRPRWFLLTRSIPNRWTANSIPFPSDNNHNLFFKFRASTHSRGFDVWGRLERRRVSRIRVAAGGQNSDSSDASDVWDLLTRSGFLRSGTTGLLGFGRIECSSKQPSSIKHFPKQLRGCLALSNSLCQRRHALLKSCFGKSTRLLKSSFSIAATSGTQDLPLLEKVKAFSFNSLKESSLGLTPFDVCKWAWIISVAIAATKWVVGLLFNPFFWMYFSWTWMYWPSLSALTIGIYGSFCLRKHYIGQASIFEQLAIVTSAITWLTLVPPGFLNGFLEGWPLVFFLVYHYFFFLNVTVRKRQYGDYYARKHDPKWDVRLPTWCQFVFFAAVMVGHWLAAMEGPELHMIPGGWWINFGIWFLIMFVIFTHYYATVFLTKYVDNTAEPTAVVQFGPYRSVRHPLYASMMLLFVSYFAALRAPLSMLYVIVVCLMYYGQKAKLEEDLMLETFGDRYTEYMNKVKFKFIPFIY